MAESHVLAVTTDNLVAENALIGQVPDLFEGKARKAPKRSERSRSESILRYELQPEDIVHTERPNEAFDENSTGFNGTEDIADVPSILLYHDHEDEEEDWTPYEVDVLYDQDTSWADETSEAADWSPEDTAMDYDDVYRTRSWLSPVQEATDESDRETSPPPFTRCSRLSINGSESTSKTTGLASETCETRPTTEYKDLAHHLPRVEEETNAHQHSIASPNTSLIRLEFLAPIKDLASTLNIPSGINPPLQIISEISLQQIPSDDTASFADGEQEPDTTRRRHSPRRGNSIPSPDGRGRPARKRREWSSRPLQLPSPPPCHGYEERSLMGKEKSASADGRVQKCKKAAHRAAEHLGGGFLDWRRAASLER
ncbi:hypothetical protein ANO11243_053660 [Dothideomycetidae sp. 11243]|nr:hypothetical protein ANO11243_053660 [fungal sp. No.11243]